MLGFFEMPSVEQDLATWSRLQTAEALMVLGLKQGHDPDREQGRSWSRACLSLRLGDVPRAWNLLWSEWFGVKMTLQGLFFNPGSITSISSIALRHRVGLFTLCRVRSWTQ